MSKDTAERPPKITVETLDAAPDFVTERPAEIRVEYPDVSYLIQFIDGSMIIETAVGEQVGIAVANSQGGVKWEGRRVLTATIDRASLTPRKGRK